MVKPAGFVTLAREGNMKDVCPTRAGTHDMKDTQWVFSIF